MPSLIDILPPEAQTLLGAIALLTAVAGLILATTGIKIARFTIALLLGLAAASLAAFLLPTTLDLSPITCALLGFAAGALTGALAFKLLQALTLALCLSLAAGSAYYQLHIQPLLPPPPPHSTAISHELIPLDALPLGPTTNKHAPPSAPALPHLLYSSLQSLATRWSAIPPAHQKRLLILTLSVAAIALLLAFGFPRPTTWLITALLGTLLLLLGLQTLLHLYAPQYEPYLPTQPRYTLLTYLLLTAIALLTQYSLFWPRKKRPAPPPPTPIPAIPTPSSTA